MEKTKEIHKALKRRKFVNAEINDIKEAIDRLTKIVNTFENEKKLLNFELHTWDIFSNKTNS
jgi:septal ring factor EnvC (AmiA/AmiB activator)